MSINIAKAHGVEVKRLRVVERPYGNSGQLNEAGQYHYDGRVGGCLVTGPAAGRRRLDR